MKALISLCTVLLLPGGVMAQANTSNNDQARGVAGKAVSDPGLQTTAAQPTSQLSLVSSNEGETQVRAEIGYLTSAPKADWIWALRITSPITKGAQETRLASLTGLGSGAKAGLHLTKIGYGANYVPDRVTDLCQRYDDALVERYGPPPRIDITNSCNVDGIRRKLANWDAPIDVKSAAQDEFDSHLLAGAAAACEEYNRSGEGPFIDCEGRRRQPGLSIARRFANVKEDIVSADREIAQRRAAARLQPRRANETWEAKLAEKTTESLKEFCQSLNTDTSKWGFLLGKSGCDADDLARAGVEWEEAVGLRPTYLSFAVELQNQTFKFAPGATLDESSESHQNLGVGASYGRLFVDAEWYLGINAAIERVYKGGTAEQLCAPVPDTTLTQCKTIARTAPTHDDNEILSLEARHLISDRLAIQPRISHDFADDVNAADVTFYLLTHKEKGLNGGVRIGYREDDEQPSVVVFIGVPFNLFGD